jgi:hypothetical protein
MPSCPVLPSNAKPENAKPVNAESVNTKSVATKSVNTKPVASAFAKLTADFAKRIPEIAGSVKDAAGCS